MVKYTYSSGKRSLARRLRHEPTDAERKLWFLLRDRRFGSAKFRRQVLIGRYVVDFVCLRQKLIVEADGGQHNENPADVVRDQWLAGEGYKVVRYGNNDILRNPGGVLEDLAQYFRASPSPGLGSLRSASATLSPRGERESKRPV